MKELINVTIGDMLDDMARLHPDNECVVYPIEGHRWTWAQFRDEANRVGRGLMAMGVKRGDHVAIWATNVKEWIITQFATAKIGAVLVTVNTNYKQFELEYLLRQSDSSTLIMIGGFKDSNYVEHVKALCPQLENCEAGQLNNPKLPFLKNLVFIGGDTPQGMYNFTQLYGMAETVTEQERAAVQASLDVYDVINMQYTSGTTGFPKGVMLTHHNLINNGVAIGDSMKFTASDRLCIAVPLFHCFGCVLGVMASLTHGTTMVIIESFNPLRVMKAVQDENCTAVHGVPTMFIAMLENPDFTKYKFTALRTGIMAGSPCPIKVMRQVAEVMGAKDITIVFGQTESSPGMTQTTTDDPLDIRVSTVGRLLPHVEGKIVDPETGCEQPRGMPGEIVTRGYHIMKGYYKMPEATAQAIDADGWLHTGDIGTQDEAGYFKITGRLKDMIIRGGENIYPREIEEFLYTHPSVRDVQVIGVPDAKYGEEVLAYVIPRESDAITEEQLMQFVREGLSRHKAPRYVRFIDAFPMTASGKIQKYKLRELAVQDLQLDKAASIETA